MTVKPQRAAPTSWPARTPTPDPLREALAAWLREDPWARNNYGDMAVGDEPWECYACGATIPFNVADRSLPDWWVEVSPGPDAAGHDDCLWVVSRAALAEPAPPLDVARLAPFLAIEFGKAGFFAPTASMEFLHAQAMMMLADAVAEYAALEPTR